jgi:prophage regulatory protein
MRAVLRFNDLKDIGIPWSKKTVYAKIRAGLFPRPIHLGGNTSAWVADEIQDWIKARIADRDNPPPKILAARSLNARHKRLATKPRKTASANNEATT